MSITPVQVAGSICDTVHVGTHTSAPVTATAVFGSNNTAGNTIVVLVSGATNNVATELITSPVVSDSQGNVYTQACWVDSGDQSGGSIGVYVASNIKAGANTVTFTYTGVGDLVDPFFDAGIIAREYSGFPSPTVQAHAIQQIYGAAGDGPITLNITDSNAASVGVTFSGPVFGSGGVGTDGALVLVDLKCGIANYLIGGSRTYQSVNNLPTTTPSGYQTFAQAMRAVRADSGDYLFFWESASPVPTVAPLAISCNNPPAGQTGIAYTHTFTASGGATPYTFSISAGALPTGLTLDAATGIASGTPTAAGTFAFTVQVTDSDSPASTTSVGCSIAILSIACNNPPAGTEGAAYTHTFTASGGATPYTFSISAGALPTGLTLDAATGIASGTPTAKGIFAFTVTMTDANGKTASVACTISISPYPPGKVLRITAVRDLWALDAAYPVTTGTPARCSFDANPTGTITLYPIPIANGTLWQAMQEFPGTIASGSSTISLPLPMQDWFSYAMLAGAKSKESPNADLAMAAHYEERCRLFTRLAEHLWGPGM